MGTRSIGRIPGARDGYQQTTGDTYSMGRIPAVLGEHKKHRMDTSCMLKTLSAWGGGHCSYKGRMQTRGKDTIRLGRVPSTRGGYVICKGRVH